MNYQESLNLIDQVVKQFHGSRQDHINLAAAVTNLQDLVTAESGRSRVAADKATKTKKTAAPKEVTSSK